MWPKRHNGQNRTEAAVLTLTCSANESSSSLCWTLSHLISSFAPLIISMAARLCHSKVQLAEVTDVCLRRRVSKLPTADTESWLQECQYIKKEMRTLHTISPGMHWALMKSNSVTGSLRAFPSVKSLTKKIKINNNVVWQCNSIWLLRAESLCIRCSNFSEIELRTVSIRSG